MDIINRPDGLIEYDPTESFDLDYYWDRLNATDISKNE